MGVTYSVIPFTEEMRHPSAQKWHEQHVPENARTGRNPTPSEMRVVLRRIAENNIIIKGQKIAWLKTEDGWVEVQYPFDGEQNEKYSFGVYGDLNMIIRVLEELSEKCGTFMLTSNGDSAVFVDRHFDAGDGYHERPIADME
ncbi:MAG: hypothetical protein AAFV33_25900 [Chloroflexota bacterium]